MSEAQVIQAMRESTIGRIEGPTILLGSGTYFDFEDPDSSEITLDDIACGLAYTGRFAGQCCKDGVRLFYSVAEHCVRMSQAVPRNLAYEALMHELGEAVCGDMTGPLKSICPDYKAIEKRCAAALERRFLVRYSDPVELKRWDMIMLATEKRDLMPDHAHIWTCIEGLDPLPGIIDPWSAELAAYNFRARYRLLKPVGAPV